jgi:2-hydroxychromene-2-carboxylate isomerase
MSDTSETLRDRRSADAAAPPLEFWFELASTYSYPAALRIEAAARDAGVAIAWRPFLLGPIFAAQGWRDSPFNLYPAKGRYMWRDLERVCASHALPLRRPSQFPRNGLLAARVALVGAEHPWGPPFVRTVYHANFAQDLDIADAGVLAPILVRLGQDPDAVLDRANDPATKSTLRRQTERAMALGLFGAPTFVSGDELFWGNDRLDDALAWHR